MNENKNKPKFATKVAGVVVDTQKDTLKVADPAEIILFATWII
jgi:hypothetical protein